MVYQYSLQTGGGFWEYFFAILFCIVIIWLIIQSLRGFPAFKGGSFI
jgi:hypothetical protein